MSATKIITYTDVPQELWDLLNRVDFSRLSRPALANWLTELHHYAGQYLPQRKDFEANIAKRGTHKIARSVPVEVIRTVQTYRFDSVGLMQRTLFLSAATAWMKKNLPLKGNG